MAPRPPKRECLPLALLAAVAASCAAPDRQAFPADLFPAAGRRGGGTGGAPARGGPEVAAIAPDGRLLWAGEPAGLSPAVLTFTRALADARARDESTAPAFRDLLGAIDRALAAGHVPRLDLLRAATACEVELEHDRVDLPAELVESAEEHLVRLAERIDAPPQRLEPWRPGKILALPVSPAVVTSFFGLRRDPLDGRPRYHLGLDLQAREGQEVAAAADGVVVSAGWASGHGNRVELLHDSGVVTGYSHLASILLPRGARVRRGQPVGLAGHTGRVTGPHLHFEVWRDGEPQDPLDALPETAAVEVRSEAPIE